jgi:D-alanyl-D-alanine carboxypeptidase
MSKTRIADELQGRLDQFRSQHPESPSATLLVETPSFAWQGAVGLADPSAGTPMHPGDSIYIASVAKMMTAAVAMRLVEDGKLGLGDPLARHLPSRLMTGLHRFEGRSYDDAITLRHLLSHRSGLADTFGTPGFMDLLMQDPNRLWKPEETIDFIKEKTTPLFAPGDGFKYSDANFTLVGLAIEAVTGGSLDAAYRRFIYEPLGLSSTYRRFLETPRRSAPDRVAAHVFYGDADFTLWRALTADCAGGGLDSTLADLNRFLRAFAHDEIFEKPATRAAMLDWRPWKGNVAYGLGTIRIDLDQDEDAAVHGLGEMWGHIGASSCFMFYWPQRDASLCGTFNQVACEGAIMPFVAGVMRCLSEAR